jgi:proline dehydrogenase
MIDAEHTYFQPAIDNITTDLIKKFNREYPVIFSTYQMYLKDSSQRLLIDAERAKKGNYCFAAKLVRGAYMVLESARAVTMKYDNPIHESLNDTHNNYNGAVKMLISSIAAGHRVEVMIATHNQHSVELALHAMEENALPPTSSVYFGQLLGMCNTYHPIIVCSSTLLQCKCVRHFRILSLLSRYERQHDIHAWPRWIQGVQVRSVR